MKETLGQARMGIVIANWINGTVRGTYVGRPSVLGNPFVIGTDGDRLQVIERYRAWLRQQWKSNGPARAALMKLARRFVEEGTLTLICHCAPKRCHAEVIQEAILGIVRKGSGKPVTQSVACENEPHTTT